MKKKQILKITLFLLAFGFEAKSQKTIYNNNNNKGTYKVIDTTQKETIINEITWIYDSLYFVKTLINKRLMSINTMITHNGINKIYDFVIKGNLTVSSTREISLYNNGMLNGNSYFLDSFYNVRKIEHYVNDTLSGRAIELYSTGVIKSKGNYKNGVKLGLWNYSNIEGILIKQGEYVIEKMDSTNENYLYINGDNFQYNFASLKDGIWKYWTKEGKLCRTEIWEKGILKNKQKYSR